MDPLTQLLPCLRGPTGARQGSEDSSTPGGGPQLQSPVPQPPAQLQSPAPQLQSPISQSLPQLQSPSPQLPSPSPQLKLQSPTQLQPAEASTPRSVNVKREPPGTPNRGSFCLAEGRSLKEESIKLLETLLHFKWGFSLFCRTERCRSVVWLQCSESVIV